MKSKASTIATLIGIASAAVIAVTAPSPRLNLTTSNTVHNCNGEHLRGATIKGDNIKLINCTMEGWSGTGLNVSGRNNTTENVIILDSENTLYDAKCEGNPCDKDAVRYFGSGHKFLNIEAHIDTCEDPSHCDVFQTYSSNAGKQIEIAFSEMYNFTVYMVGTKNLKGQCLQAEYGASDHNIHHNILNCYRGINLGDSAYPPTNNFTITNNTFIGQIPPPISSVLEWGVFISNGTNTTVKYNIFYNLVGEHLKGTITAGNNLVYRSDSGRLYEPRFATDLWNINPLLDSNYCPLPSSPARTAGIGYLCTAGIVTSVPPTITIQPVTATITPSPTVTMPGTATIAPSRTPTKLPAPFLISVNGTPVYCAKPCQIVIP